MKKGTEQLRNLFGLLWVLSLVCMVVGLMIGADLGASPVIRRMGRAGTSVADVLILLSAAANDVLWMAAWASFMGLCRRMMRGGTAFTPENRRTLGTIGACVALIGLLVFLRCVSRLWTAPLLYSLLEAIVVPGTFWTVALLAFILRQLLKKAMVLEEDQQGVV